MPWNFAPWSSCSTTRRKRCRPIGGCEARECLTNLALTLFQRWMVNRQWIKMRLTDSVHCLHNGQKATTWLPPLSPKVGHLAKRGHFVWYQKIWMTSICIEKIASRTQMTLRDPKNMETQGIPHFSEQLLHWSNCIVLRAMLFSTCTTQTKAFWKWRVYLPTESSAMSGYTLKDGSLIARSYRCVIQTRELIYWPAKSQPCDFVLVGEILSTVCPQKVSLDDISSINPNLHDIIV
jgi:hypothetical protein